MNQHQIVLKVKSAKTQDIYACPENLPRVPAIGESLVIDVKHRDERNFIKVIDVVYQLQLGFGEGYKYDAKCVCYKVEVIGECTKTEPLGESPKAGAIDDTDAY